MADTIALVNQKGGVGKTTTAVNLGYVLAQQGRRTLLFDADPQASLTIYLGHDEHELDAQRKTLYYALLEDVPLSEIVIPGEEGEPSLIPTSIRLGKPARDLMTHARYSATLLREKLRELAEAFDHILIDCPPNLEILTLNALVAADRALIPAKTDTLSNLGIPLLLAEIDEVRRTENPQLTVLGILPTIHNARYRQDSEALEALSALATESRIRIFEPIARSTQYDRAGAEGRPGIVFAPRTPGIKNYYKVADAILNHASR